MMKRWFVFFFLVLAIAAFAGLGLFNGSSTAEQTGGAVGNSKLLFLSAMAFAGLSFVAFMAYASHRQRRASRQHLDPEAQARSFEHHDHAQHHRASGSG